VAKQRQVYTTLHHTLHEFELLTAPRVNHCSRERAWRQPLRPGRDGGCRRGYGSTCVVSRTFGPTRWHCVGADPGTRV